MKQTLTLEDIDDYVKALTAFLPTPDQRQMIEEYASIIEKNPQYQIVVQRELNLIGVPDAFLKPQTICISDIIENKL